MKISYDEAKRDWKLEHRDLDFEDARTVFEGRCVDLMDDRKDYGETRYQTIGWLREALVMIVWTPRDGGRRIISMRKCNDDDKARFSGVSVRPL